MSWERSGLPPADPFLEERLARFRRPKRSSRRGFYAAFAVGIVVLAAALAIWLVNRSASYSPAVAGREGKPTGRQEDTGFESPAQADLLVEDKVAVGTRSGSFEGRWGSPTSGPPLDLHYLPAGGLLLVSFRPAEVLESATGQEVRAGLKMAADPLLAQLQAMCGVDPSRIEHVLVSWIPNTDGRPPRMAAAVRLREPMARSALLAAWDNPQPAQVGAVPYYVAAKQERGYYVADERTFAVAPAELLQELLPAVDQVQPTGPAIEALLQHSDSQRHFSLVFDVQFLRDDGPRLVPPEALPLWREVLGLLGDDASAGIFSLHLETDFFAELLLQTSNVSSPRRLAQKLEERWQDAPYRLREQIGKLRPPAAARRLVGRFPAMVKAAAVCTSVERSGRVVQARVALPQRAGPNLAWAAPQVLRELGRQAAGTPARPAAGSASGPLALQQRLARPITVSFRRTPLRQAVAMIGEEAGIEVQFLMKDLEEIGVTGNMPQAGEYREVPAQQVLSAILMKLELAYVVREQENKVIITSRKAAAARGQRRP